MFALVCKEWRKAQLKVGGPLRTRVESDVILPGSAALAKWALAEGCPRYYSMAHCAALHGMWYTMASIAAKHGHLELVKWLYGEGGYAMDKVVMWNAARGGNLELVKWLRAEGCEWNEDSCCAAAQGGNLEVLKWLRSNGCPWDHNTCLFAVDMSHVEMLRWARENGCPWDADTRDGAAAKLGYTDDLGNLVEASDDEDFE